MKVEYQREGNHNYLLIETKEPVDGFVIQMLSQNRIIGLLDFHVGYLNNQSSYYYNISSKQSLLTILERKKADKAFLKSLIEQIKNTMKELEEYLLDSNKIILLPESIYLNPNGEEVFFCYYPEKEDGFEQEMEKLLKYLLDKVDYQSKEAVTYIYALYQEVKHFGFQFDSIPQKEEEYFKGEHEDLAYEEEKIKGLKEEEKKEAIRREEVRKEEIRERGKRILRADMEVPVRDYNRYSKEEESNSKKDCNREEKVVDGWEEQNERARRAKRRMLIKPHTPIETVWEEEERVYNWREDKKIRYGMESLCAIYIIFTGFWLYQNQFSKASFFQCLAAGFVLIALSIWSIQHIMQKYQAQIVSKPVKVSYEEKEEKGEEKEEMNTILLSYEENDVVKKLVPIRQAGETIYLDRFPFLIGKLKEQADYVLEAEGVSRMHAKLEAEGERYFITDLNSTNGLFVDGIRLAPHECKEIHPGCEIRIGTMDYVFQESSSTA